MKQGFYRRVFAKKVEYKGILFNSTLEADFAKFLDGRIIKHDGKTHYHPAVEWTYESRVFELLPSEEWVDRTERDKSVKRIKRNKTHTLQKVVYTPDFYLPAYDLYVETKGRQFDDALFHMRLRLFKNKYKDTAIWVVRHHDDFDRMDEVIENLTLKGKDEK